jgi:hypothetical protein
MPVLGDLAVAGAGGAVAVLLREGVRVIRTPRFDIDHYEAQGERPHIPRRIMSEDPVDISGERAVKREVALDLHLSIGNIGYKPAKRCEVSLDIYEEGELLPKPIRLGSRRKPPKLYEKQTPESLRDRISPFDINKKDAVLVDLLRLRFIEYEKKSTENIVHKHLNKLTTLSSFESHDFKMDTDYMLEINVTGANANPKTARIELNWNGGIEVEDLKSSIYLRRPNM